jgi:hypothetical protein
MKPIKGKIQSVITELTVNSLRDRYYQPQIEIGDRENEQHRDLNAKFLEYLDSIAHHSHIDELDMNKGPARITTDLELKDIIHNAQTGMACGIQLVFNPLGGFNEWDKWEEGYIEGFCRMEGDKTINRSHEWFYWAYIKMSYLPEILKEFEDYLYYMND